MFTVIPACSVMDRVGRALNTPLQDDGPDQKLDTLELTPAELSLYQTKNWQLSGRASVMSEKGVWTGALRWMQDNKRVVLRMDMPLGQGAFKLVGDDFGVELTTADGRSLQSDDMDTLFSEEIGWAVPVTGLRYWVFGIPNKEKSAALQRDEAHRITVIEQSGWKIQIQDYQEVGPRLLPRKLSLTNNELHIRLVIHHWQLPSIAPV